MPGIKFTNEAERQIDDIMSGVIGDRISNAVTRCHPIFENNHWIWALAEYGWALAEYGKGVPSKDNMADFLTKLTREVVEEAILRPNLSTERSCGRFLVSYDQTKAPYGVPTRERIEQAISINLRVDYDIENTEDIVDQDSDDDINGTVYVITEEEEDTYPDSYQVLKLTVSYLNGDVWEWYINLLYDYPVSEEKFADNFTMISDDLSEKINGDNPVVFIATHYDQNDRAITFSRVNLTDAVDVSIKDVTDTP